LSTINNAKNDQGVGKRGQQQMKSAHIRSYLYIIAVFLLVTAWQTVENSANGNLVPDFLKQLELQPTCVGDPVIWYRNNFVEAVINFFTIVCAVFGFVAAKICWAQKNRVYYWHAVAFAFFPALSHYISMCAYRIHWGGLGASM
jgi:hypothetical protein